MSDKNRRGNLIERAKLQKTLRLLSSAKCENFQLIGAIRKNSKGWKALVVERSS